MFSVIHPKLITKNIIHLLPAAAQCNKSCKIHQPSFNLPSVNSDRNRHQNLTTHFANVELALWPHFCGVVKMGQIERLKNISEIMKIIFFY